MSGFGDRRYSPRILCDIPVQYTRTGIYSRDAWVINIGSGGVLLTTTEEIPVGITLSLRFLLPLSTHPVQVLGQVRWVHLRKVGIEFAGLTDWQKEQIVWLHYAKEEPSVRAPAL